MGRSRGVQTKLSVDDWRLTENEIASLNPEKRIGEGQTSEVWSGRTASGHELALKIALPNQESHLRREAHALAVVGGKGVVRLRGCGRVDGRFALATDFVDGQELRQLLVEGGPAEEARTLATIVLRDVGAALARLHRLGWAHGDVKPENIVIDRSAERAVLIDLGLVNGSEEIRGGTPRYLPPGVLHGQTQEPRSSDVWALAVVLSEIFLGLDVPIERKALDGLEPEFLAILGPVLFADGAARPGLSLLLSEARERGIVEASSEDVTDVLRTEYLATRLAELESISTEDDILVDGPPGKWLQRVVALRAQAESGEKRRSVTPLKNCGPHERCRFLGRLVGPAAADWFLPPTTDAELIETLASLADGRGLRSILLSELTRALARTSKPGDPELSLDDSERRARWAIELGRRPIPLRTLTAIAADTGGSSVLRLEAARAARQAGENRLSHRLLDGCDSAESELERAILLNREGLKDDALELCRQLLKSSQWRIRSRAQALVARSAIDRGESREALQLLKSEAETPAVCETRGLAHLMIGEFELSRRDIELGLSLAENDEARARLSGLRGMLEHAEGRPSDAMSSFGQAIAQASAAGAALEEATYATGLAAASSDAGLLADALAASQRAEILFEALNQEAAVGRALLARASVLAAVGAEAELANVVRRGLHVTRQSGDTRCQGYLLLAYCDGSTDRGIRRSCVEQAQELLEDVGPDDRLRLAVRRLNAWGKVEEDGDDWAQQSGSVETKFEWWRARALALETASVESNPSRGVPALEGDGARVIQELLTLSVEPRRIAVAGPALVAGAHLALRLGKADDARTLLSRASEHAAFFLQNAPAEHRLAASQLLWIQQARGQRLDASSGAAQLGDVEGLLRALSGRNGFAPLLNQVLDMLLLWTGVQRGMLLLRAPEGKLSVRAARNLDKLDLSEEQRTLSLSLARRALDEGRPVVAVDAVHDLPSMHRSVHALNLRSVLAVPLVARGEVLGVAYLDDKVRRGAFGEKELSWVSLIGTVAALAIADERDRLQLKRALGRAKRAEARLAGELTDREAELEVAERALSRVKSPDKLRGDYSQIVGRGAAMSRLLSVVDRVAHSDVPALIFGESGTGKELIARAMAESGPRKDGPMVAENCGAVPEGLLESTLFGHEKGAFTGASRSQAGLFTLAHRGTLFLDEIGEMSLPMQTKLLRVLQEGEVRPLGSNSTRKVDVRLIVATHRDLKALVAEGLFREDLYYRLNVVTLEVPPLRDRVEDIAPLARHFVERHSGDSPRQISDAALARLTSFAWPGNVRQLENEIRRMLVLGGEVLSTADLSPEILGASSEMPEARTLKEKVDALERRLVTEALEEVGGNRTRAAEVLGLSRFGLQKMTQRLNIEVPKVAPKSGRKADRGLDDT